MVSNGHYGFDNAAVTRSLVTTGSQVFDVCMHTHRVNKLRKYSLTICNFYFLIKDVGRTTKNYKPICIMLQYILYQMEEKEKKRNK
jgi:hypothetical protein